MKTLNFTIQCMCTYESSIEVPDYFCLREAIEYAKAHLDDVPVGVLTYVGDSDVLDEESCRFKELPQEEAAPMYPHKKGDVCTYSFGDKNASVAVVKIVKILNDKRGAAEIKFLKVINDDTGNGYFNYLLKTGGTMNASLKYLHLVDNEEE